MFRKTTAAFLLSLIVAAGAVNVSASTIPASGTTTIVPNRLTVRWEDGSRPPVTIDTFRFHGFNVAQLRTMVSVLDGSVSDLADGTYQIRQSGTPAGFREITFNRQTDINFMINHTQIRNDEGTLVRPNQPGWVFLTDYEYNWASVRDVINAMNLSLIDVFDDPAAGTTEVVVRRAPPEIRPPGQGTQRPPGGARSLTVTPSSLTVTSGSLLTTPGNLGLTSVTPGALATVTPGSLIVSGGALYVPFRVEGTATGSIALERELSTGMLADVSTAVDGNTVVVRIVPRVGVSAVTGTINITAIRDRVEREFEIRLTNVTIP
jgi:hypothetical protein